MLDADKYINFVLAKELLFDLYQATVEGLQICDIALFSGDPASIPAGNQILANFFKAVEPTEEQVKQYAEL